VVGLRNVAVTAPYMHNGMFKTLNEVVAYYNEPDNVLPNSVNRDTSVKKLNLSKQEENDLVEFLKSLTDSRFTNK
jgi:cytochrome c peroxidase